MKGLLCPYMKNGTCYHSHCIYKPNYECNKPFTNKNPRKNKTHVKRVKIKDFEHKLKESLRRWKGSE